MGGRNKYLNETLEEANYNEYTTQSEDNTTSDHSRTDDNDDLSPDDDDYSAMNPADVNDILKKVDLCSCNTNGRLEKIPAK